MKKYVRLFAILVFGIAHTSLQAVEKNKTQLSNVSQNNLDDNLNRFVEKIKEKAEKELRRYGGDLASAKILKGVTQDNLRNLISLFFTKGNWPSDGAITQALDGLYAYDRAGSENLYTGFNVGRALRLVKSFLSLVSFGGKNVRTHRSIVGGKDADHNDSFKDFVELSADRNSFPALYGILGRVHEDFMKGRMVVNKKYPPPKDLLSFVRTDFTPGIEKIVLHPVNLAGVSNGTLVTRLAKDPAFRSKNGTKLSNNVVVLILSYLDRTAKLIREEPHPIRIEWHQSMTKLKLKKGLISREGHDILKKRYDDLEKEYQDNQAAKALEAVADDQEPVVATVVNQEVIQPVRTTPVFQPNQNQEVIQPGTPVFQPNQNQEVIQPVRTTPVFQPNQNQEGADDVQGNADDVSFVGQNLEGDSIAQDESEIPGGILSEEGSVRSESSDEDDGGQKNPDQVGGDAEKEDEKRKGNAVLGKRLFDERDELEKK